MLSRGITTLFFATLLAATGCDGGSGAPPAPSGPPGKLGTGKITGVVKYDGPAAAPVELDTSGIPECHAAHKGAITSEALLVDGGKLRFAIVSVKTGPEGTVGAVYDPPAAPAILDQKGCMYAPHVSAIQARQTLKIHNSDPIYHNVHCLAKRPGNDEFNISMPNAGDESPQTFRVGEVVKFKCDAHTWMSSYVGVYEHPFFSVSGADGAFEITRLPAGEYTIEAWHEKLGVQEAKVTLAEGESKTVEIVFKK